MRRRPRPALFPYPTLFRSRISPLEAGWIEVETRAAARQTRNALHIGEPRTPGYGILNARVGLDLAGLRTVVGVDNILDHAYRSEEHTSELQSRGHLVCRLL